MSAISGKGGSGDGETVFRAGFPALGARRAGEPHWGIRSPMVEMGKEWGVEG